VLDNDATRCMNNEADDAANLNEEKSNDNEKEVRVVGKLLRSLSFCERMKGLSPHRRPLKKRCGSILCNLAKKNHDETSC
jgi:hypothetical protein